MPDPAPAADAVETVQMPSLSMRAAVRGDSINVEARTVDLVFSTGAPVRRFDWSTGDQYFETLSMESGAVRLDRLNRGAPFLNAHDAYALDKVLGVVVADSARVADKQGTATVRFSKRADVEPIFQDVRDGILRNVSVGYIVHRYAITPATPSTPQLRHAVDWEPFEISAVPIPADAGAQMRDATRPTSTYPCVMVRAIAGDAPKGEPPMPDEPTTPPVVAATREPADIELVPNEADAVKDLERRRITGILNACEAVRLPMSEARKYIDAGTALVDAQSALIETLKVRGFDRSGPAPGPASGRVAVASDPLENVWRGITGALLHRMSPEYFKLDDNARQYRSFSLMRTMEECLEQKGVRTRMLSKPEIVERALHTTSDFPLILADAANKTLRAAYEAAPQTWQVFSRRIEAPDFKSMNRLQLGEAPALLKVLEHGEFKSGTIGEGKESFALATYGRIFGITRQGLINDDLDAFGRIIVGFAQSARNLESDLVYYQLLANLALTNDSLALFEAATHKNLTTGPGTAISIDSLGIGRAMIRNQRGIDGVTFNNLMPKYLLVPPSKETVADQYTSQITPALSGNVNPFSGKLTTIAEPRLEGGVIIDGVTTAGSATAWYLMASTDQRVDMIEYAYLAGSDGPDIITRAGFEIDGVQTRARHDFAAKAIDYRGMYKNVGA